MSIGIDYSRSYFIDALYFNKKPAFPLEQELAAAMLNVWILCGEDRDFMEQAPLFIASRFASQIKERKLKDDFLQALSEKVGFETLLKAHSNSHRLTEMVVALDERVYKARWIFHIVNYFMSAPQPAPDSKFVPSLNKAFYFIDAGGLGDDHKASISTLKDSWWTFRHVAAFIFADILGGCTITFLTLDDPKLLTQTRKIVANRGHLEVYFGTVKHAQRLLEERFSEGSRDPFPPIIFPKDIEEASFDPPPYDKRQNQIIKSYMAPKAMDSLPPKGKTPN